MFELLLVCAGFALGIITGVNLSKIFHREMIKKILEEAGVSNHDLHQAQRHIQAQLAAEQAPTEVDINVEQHSGCYYAFRKSNDEFLGQGEDYVTLLTALQRKLGTNHTVNLDYSVARDIPGFPEVKGTKVE